MTVGPSRHPVEGTVARPSGRDPVPSGIGQDLLQVARDDPDTALRRLRGHVDGLSAREAAARLGHHGPNRVTHDDPLSGWRHLMRCLLDPFNLLLSALATISWLAHDLKATAVIGAMVALSTAVRVAQEHRSVRAAESLRAMVSNTATVLRQGRREVPMAKLVPGDLVLLSAGDMVPADCRVLVARDLFVAQSALTGESLPVEKFAAWSPSDNADLLAQGNLIFMGTNVISGTATALVVHTGGRTYFGSMAARLAAADAQPRAFQVGVNRVSWLLIRLTAVTVPLVMLVNGITKGNWPEAFLFALAVGVGLTPQMLPMIVTATLAHGAVKLARRKVVVKRLEAIPDLGAMDVLCTDKTGTLTQDKIALAQHIDALGHPCDEVLALAFLNSHYQTGLKNLLDRAILEHVELPTELRLAQAYRLIDEIPFDFQRRRMSVVVAERDEAHVNDEHHELICKGALEEVLAVCTRVRCNDVAGYRELPLDERMRSQVREVADHLGRSGLRVVAVAMKELPPQQTVYSTGDEMDLVLMGYVAFLDPPRESAAPALRQLASHGIRIKVLTGDHERVAQHVCAQVGLAPGPILCGPDLDMLDDEALARAAAAHQVFARLSPLHKERIVRALRSHGHVVGFLGDGINDAPALAAADLGISVDTAVDIAREAADIVLLEKSLTVLDEGVVEGRTTFCNLLKYLRTTVSSNVGNVLSLALASVFLPFLPMLPLHLLVQNLLYDIAQTAIPFDRVDEALVAEPLQWNSREIVRFVLCFGPASSVFDLATYAVMWGVFAANTVATQGLFQSGWFVVGLLTQTLVVHMIRTPRLPWVQSRASPVLTTLSIAVGVMGLWLPAGMLAPYLKFQPLPEAFYAWLAGLLLGYACLITLMKRWYTRRFGWH